MGSGMIMAGLIAEHISLSAIFWANILISGAGLLFFRSYVIRFYEDNLLPVSHKR